MRLAPKTSACTIRPSPALNDPGWIGNTQETSWFDLALSDGDTIRLRESLRRENEGRLYTFLPSMTAIGICRSFRIEGDYLVLRRSGCGASTGCPQLDRGRLIGGFDFIALCGRCQLYQCSQIGSSAARRSEYVDRPARRPIRGAPSG